MSSTKPPALPAKAKKSAAVAHDGGDGIDRAFRVANDEAPMTRLDSEPRVSFATWDGERIDLDVELAVFRRERFTKYVKGIMAVSLAICAIALVRAAAGNSPSEEPMAAAASLSAPSAGVTTSVSAETPVTAVAKTIKDHEVPVAIREIQAFTRRTQAAMKSYERREAAKASVAQRTRAFW